MIYFSEHKTPVLCIERVSKPGQAPFELRKWLEIGVQTGASPGFETTTRRSTAKTVRDPGRNLTENTGRSGTEANNSAVGPGLNSKARLSEWQSDSGRIAVTVDLAEAGRESDPGLPVMVSSRSVVL